VRLFLDDAQPDEDPTAGLYAASTPGDASYFGGPYSGLAGEPVQSVTANAGAGTWSFVADAGILGGFFDTTASGTLTGQSLVPDQILPELGPASGQIVFALDGTGGAQLVVEVSQVALPEPGLAGLAGAALLALGARYAGQASPGRRA